MYFKINQRKFLNTISTCAKAISSIAPHPALSGIKITCYENYLECIASDSNISIKTIVYANEQLEIKEPGAIVIDARYLLEIIRKMKTDTIEIEVIDGGYTKIYSSTTEFKINGLRSSDYPAIDFAINGPFFPFKHQHLSEIIDDTAFAISDNEIRPALTGVNLVGKDNKILAIATDSFRLAKKEINTELNHNFNIIIPVKYLKEIQAVVPEGEDFELALSNKKLQVKTEDTIIQTRLIDEIFPDTSKFLSIDYQHCVKVDSKKLAEAIDRTLFIRQDGKNIVKLEITTGNIHLTSSTQEIGSYQEDIPISNFEGEKFTISCSGKYLLDALRSFRQLEVNILLSGELKPIVIQSDHKTNLTQLVSPVRTYN